MAKLSDFLGGLVSSFSNARVNADIQSLNIAEAYSKNELLQHFAVPRMRIQNVELTIPVAVDKLSETRQVTYEPIDNKSFAAKAYHQVLLSLSAGKLPLQASRILRSTIAENVQVLESRIKYNQGDGALEEFSKTIASNVIAAKDSFLVEKNRKPLVEAELVSLHTNIFEALQSNLKGEIRIKSEVNAIESVHVIVEASRLREEKPENVIMIKMVITEEGMLWNKVEKDSGVTENKLLPE